MLEFKSAESEIIGPRPMIAVELASSRKCSSPLLAKWACSAPSASYVLSFVPLEQAGSPPPEEHALKKVRPGISSSCAHPLILLANRDKSDQNWLLRNKWP